MEYEELPAVFDPLEALRKDALILHPEVNSYIGLPRPLENPSNAFARGTWSKGNIDEGFAQADLNIENTFMVPRQHQVYLYSFKNIIYGCCIDTFLTCEVPRKREAVQRRKWQKSMSPSYGREVRETDIETIVTRGCRSLERYTEEVNAWCDIT